MPLKKSKKTLTQTVELNQNGNTLDSTFSDVSEWAPEGSEDSISVSPTQEKPQIRKPKVAEWFRTTGDMALWRMWLLVDLEPAGLRNEWAILHPSLQAQFDTVAKRVLLVPTISLTGGAFMWPIPMSAELNPWTVSARQMADSAKGQWLCRIRGTGKYAWQSGDVDADLQFPDWDIGQWLSETFATDRIVDSLEHPVALYLMKGVKL